MAVGEYVALPTVAVVGAARRGELIVWLPLLTVNDCWTCGAALKLPLPAWFASITQLPAPVNDTTPPLIEHTELAVPSTVSCPTTNPDVAVAAAGVYVAPPTVAVVGAVT